MFALICSLFGDQTYLHAGVIFREASTAQSALLLVSAARQGNSLLRIALPVSFALAVITQHYLAVPAVLPARYFLAAADEQGFNGTALLL